MKVLVCITQVPDTTSKIEFIENNTRYNTAGVTFILNPYDEWYALVRALELQEAGKVKEIDLVTVGGSETEPVIRKAMALGGKKAYRIDGPSEDPYQVASQIAAFAQDRNYDLILCGKESIDYNNGVVGGYLAGFLDWHFLGFGTHLDLEEGHALVRREIEGGEEHNRVPLPLVLSCQKGMAEARIPNLKSIMEARRKPLEVIAPKATEAKTEVVSYELPAPKSGVKMFSEDQLDELVAALHEEAKVI